uniref:Uncharacterized protein n=1 Tax=Octopus bimaculoides TaxID=37653 RepID=A0A0L8FTA1_OCTBM
MKPTNIEYKKIYTSCSARIKPGARVAYARSPAFSGPLLIIALSVCNTILPSAFVT